MRVLSKLPGLLLSTLAPAVVVAFALAGCSDSDDPDTPADAAVDSTADSATDIPSADGAVEDTAVEDTAVEDTAVEDTAVDSNTPDGDASPVDPPPFDLSSVVFSGSNWVDTFMMGVFDVAAGSVSGTYTSDVNDSAVSTSAQRAFLLTRDWSAGKKHQVSVMKADEPWKKDFDVTLPGDLETANPYQVVTVSATKAYAIFYGSNKLATFHPGATGAVGTVDLSAYVSAADGDGKADPKQAVFDANSKRLYVLLERTNMAWEGTSSGAWAYKCHDDVAPLVVAINTETDKVVDLNGAAEGEAIELKGFNPRMIQWDHAKKNLVVLHSGCAPEADLTKRVKRGLEVVDLATAATSWALNLPETNAKVAVWNYVTLSETQGAMQLLDSDSNALTWHKVDLAAKTLDTAVWNLPTAFVIDPSGLLLGLSKQKDADTGWDVVRYDLATNSATEILADVLPTDKVNGQSITVSPLK